jgi:hypothetical protein
MDRVRRSNQDGDVVLAKDEYPAAKGTSGCSDGARQDGASPLISVLDAQETS